jgi:hypothetical protein|nr:hypothetical protein [Kofleriaceae bacterium]
MTKPTDSDDNHDLGELVRGHLELSADDVPAPRFDQMWREIDQSIAEPVAAPALGVWGTVTQWLDRKLGYIITGVASAGAVAAIALVMHGGGGGTVDNTDVSAPAFGGAPAQLESLETPGGTATVMEMHDEDGDATVIWVTSDDIEGQDNP